MRSQEGERGGWQVSVLAERAPSEGPRSTRAVETPPAASLKAGGRRLRSVGREGEGGVARASPLLAPRARGINESVKLEAVLGSCAQWEIAQATPQGVEQLEGRRVRFPKDGESRLIVVVDLSSTRSLQRFSTHPSFYRPVQRQTLFLLFVY